MGNNNNDIKNQGANSGKVGDRLCALLGEDLRHKYSKAERRSLVGIIDEIIQMVENFRIAQKVSKRINDNCVIDFLFPNMVDKDERKKIQISTQCVLDFLIWCKDVIVRQRYVPWELLRNFIYDISHQNFLGKNFSDKRCQRAHSWIVQDTFLQAFKWFSYGIVPQRLLGETMCIFELRQTMELAFQGVLGLKGYSRNLHIKHNVIPSILKKNLTTDNFSPKSGVTLTQIMHVYAWANASVHSMSTDFVWIVWKALMVGSSFFEPVPRSEDWASIYDNFKLSEQLLNKVRKEFVDRVSKDNKKLEQFTVIWGAPEAVIIDANNMLVKLGCKTEVVTNSYYSPKVVK